MAYKVILAKSAIRELAEIPSRTHDKIVEYIRALELDPRPFGAEKLTGMDAYKLRVGNFRIVYEIHDRENEVKVLIVDDRKQVPEIETKAIGGQLPTNR